MSGAASALAETGAWMQSALLPGESSIIAGNDLIGYAALGIARNGIAHQGRGPTMLDAWMDLGRVMLTAADVRS